MAPMEAVARATSHPLCLELAAFDELFDGALGKLAADDLIVLALAA